VSGRRRVDERRLRKMQEVWRWWEEVLCLGSRGWWLLRLLVVVRGAARQILLDQ
jgi:hypothetical protein